MIVKATLIKMWLP